eukprot:820924-Amphidinium_carterae.1
MKKKSLIQQYPPTNKLLQWQVKSVESEDVVTCSTGEVSGVPNGRLGATRVRSLAHPGLPSNELQTPPIDDEKRLSD